MGFPIILLLGTTVCGGLADVDSSLPSMKKSSLSASQVGVCGYVFDVSSGSDHYGLGGKYSMLAGRDASRALASGAFDEATLARGSDVEGVIASKLPLWCALFKKKYSIVAELVD